MRKIVFVVISYAFLHNLFAQNYLTPFEKDPKRTATYQECISYYKLLDVNFRMLKMKVAGPSDVGYPIHLVIIDENGSDNPVDIRRKKAIIWINNGIHPGEPEGIDATMMLARDFLINPEMRKVLHRATIVIVPVFNVGGSLIRNENTRMNQNGPESYGFRGNYNNLDLNRDFIKQDSRNAITFATQFQYWRPDVFIDNHTTDGADYPYQISLLAGMRSKLSKPIEEFMYGKMIPELYTHMIKDKIEMIPYVNFEDRIENGIYAFNDKARFSSGYAALFHSIPFVVETHMLKPFHLRVASTYRIVKNIIDYASLHAHEIKEVKKLAFEETSKQKVFQFKWKMDLTRSEEIDFKGYSQSKKYYPLLQDSILFYDQNSLINSSIPHYQYYTSTLEIVKPKYYVIPYAYREVISNLKRNGVIFRILKRDTIIKAKYYRILDYKSPETPYENHFLHTQILLREESLSYPYHVGDVIVPTDQYNIKFIMEVLEPQADDSYFAWNFFDGILMRKEYYSDYLFAPKAEEELLRRPELNKSLLEFIKRDSVNNSKIGRKLDFLYKNSKYAEPYYCLYPVARIM